jgi:hypothetical protein
MGSSSERGRRGEGEEEEGGAAWGAREARVLWGGAPGLQPHCYCCSLFACCCCCSREKKRSCEEEEKEEREKKKKRRKKNREKKEKNMEIFPNLKIFGDKNKRQFMKLVKIIFVQESYMSNYK